MLETAQKIEYPEKSKPPRSRFNRKIFEDFLESVPVIEDLYQTKDELHPTHRASAFLGMIKSLETILDHFDELSKEEQQLVLARTDKIVTEAHKWTHSSDTRDIQRELEGKISRARSIARNRTKLKIVRVQKFS